MMADMIWKIKQKNVYTHTIKYILRIFIYISTHPENYKGKNMTRRKKKRTQS